MPKEYYFRADRITICDSKGGFSPISNGDHCFHSPDVNNLFATLRQLIVLLPYIYFIEGNILISLQKLFLLTVTQLYLS